MLGFADAAGLPEVLAAAEELVPAAGLVLAAAGALLEELELHPATRRMEPIAAVAATIAFDARKVTLPCSPGGIRASVGILARQVGIFANHVEREVACL